jgi:hypothetical protein
MSTSSLTSKITVSMAAALAAAVVAMTASSPALARAVGSAATVSHSDGGRFPQGTAPAPEGRQWAGFAYDTARGEFVLFGGDDSVNVLGDTWIREHGLWIRQDPAQSPSPRTGAAMVYDAATRQLLLFGGSTGFESGFQADTWQWTGSTWRKLHPAASPPARHNADMVYDAATHDVVLFGGYDGSYLGDTWSWNGTIWTRLSPATSPSPRDSESMAYDQATRTAILFGGFSTSTGRLGETWSWNGTTWTQLNPATSPGVITTAWQAAYDPATREVLVYGGDPGNSRPFLSQTWGWNGTTWTQLTPAAWPRGRGYGSMAYDSSDHRILLFGGYNNTPRFFFPTFTARWDGTKWRRAS